MAASLDRSATRSAMRLRFNERRFDDDEVLREAMLAKVPLAWRAFQERFQSLVLHCIRRVTYRAGAITQDHADEIYATFFLSLVANDMHKLRRFDPARGTQLSGWIGLLAVNCSYDYLRALRREVCTETMASAKNVSCGLPDPFETIAQRQRAAIATTALSEFGEKDRVFARLYFGEGIHPGEIATRLKISVKTVYSKKHKIETRLKSRFRAGFELRAAGHPARRDRAARFTSPDFEP